jgi:hypothetical protein
MLCSVLSCEGILGFGARPPVVSSLVGPRRCEKSTISAYGSTQPEDDEHRVTRRRKQGLFDNPVADRRASVAQLLLSAPVVATLLIAGAPRPSHATYSAYTRREQDWSERSASGQVQYSSARALKKQLRDIAPMNTSKSLLFCPNGPSSAVSPLMENRCSDAQAMPSVFGRTSDVVGNSIPGFSQRPTSGNALNPSGVTAFPKY